MPRKVKRRRSLNGVLSKNKPISRDTVRWAMRKLRTEVQKCSITPKMLKKGMVIEREHVDVTHGAVTHTALIAIRHLCERPDYYERLEKYVEVG